jgi:hypothetical protein
MPRLIALTPINHDGHAFDVGDTFDVTSKAQVAQLVESGAATIKGQKSKAEVTAEATELAAQTAAVADKQAIADAASKAAADGDATGQ